MSGKMSGLKCKVYIGDALSGTILAGQRSATLNRSAETIDATSKDSEGGWKESLSGFKEWSIDCDGAFVTNDVAYKTLEQNFMNSENLAVYIEMPSGTKYVGEATITDFPLEFPYDDLVTWSITLQGSGALTVG